MCLLLVYIHMEFKISDFSSQSMASKNISILFISNQAFHYDGFFSYLSQIFKDFLQLYLTFLPLRLLTQLLACKLALKTLTCSTFKWRAMVLSIHTIFLTTLLNVLVSKTDTLLFQPFDQRKNTAYNHLTFYPATSIALYWHLEQTLLSCVSA